MLSPIREALEILEQRELIYHKLQKFFTLLISALHEEEQTLLQKAVNDFGDRFLRLVQKHRKLSEQAFKEISTGRVLLADDAWKLGLVDKIGYLSDAVKESKKLARVSEDARVVVYRRVEFPEDNYYNVAGVASEDLNISAISINLTETLSLKAGFYYLWPGAMAFER